MTEAHNATVVQPEERHRSHGGDGGAIPARSLFFHSGKDDDAKELIQKFHYSRRWPSNVQHVFSLHTTGGLFGNCGACQASAVFSIPPTRWSEPVLELSRLVRGERRVPLSLLLKLAASAIRKAGEYDLLVSFADATQGHEGYVYRASNWNYHGKRNPACDGLIVDGTFVPGRSCNSTWGTRSAAKLSELLPDSTIEEHVDEGKHIYWFPLSQSGRERAERLGLRSERKAPTCSPT